MRIWHWVIVASLLLEMSANAQQSANPAASAITVPASAPSTLSSAMDQVVDRAVDREHALIEMLKTRTPIVETYLQNLKFDRQLGPAPAQPGRRSPRAVRRARSRSNPTLEVPSNVMSVPRELSEVVSVDPRIFSGAAVFRGTRVPVRALLDHLEAGDPPGRVVPHRAGA